MGLSCRDVPLANMDFQYWNPTRILFGNGKVRDLAADLDLDWGFDDKHRTLVVTDPGVKAAGLLDYLLDSLRQSSRQVVCVFDQVLPEAERDQVYEIARTAEECQPDFWIALGGGSVMDACKAAAVLESNGGDLEDYEGLHLVEQGTKPIICIPTTAGTGSEVTAGAVVMDRTRRRKVIIGDYKFAPKLAVLDPELTKTLPPHLVVATALDALTHSIGALASKDRQDFSSALALRAVEMIADNLEEAFHDNASNLQVRAKMLIAATMAGIAFQSAVPGADHAIGHAAGALYHLHHGLAVAIANLYVMEYNLSTVPHVYADVARALGVADQDLSEESLGRKGIQRLRELYEKVGVKLSYKEYGFPTDDLTLDLLVEQSLEDACMVFNPAGASRTPEYELLVRRCVGV
ncbi:MAG: iron-containing alcohol dehydrogenase [bacterium]